VRGSTPAVLAGVVGAFVAVPGAQAQNLPDARPLVTVVTGDAGTVVSGAVSALPPAVQGDVATAVEKAETGVFSGVFPIPFQLVGVAGPVADPGPYPGNTRPDPTSDPNPAPGTAGSGIPPLEVPSVKARMLSKLPAAVRLRRAVVALDVSGPGRLVLGGTLRGRRIGETAISFGDAGTLRVNVGLDAAVRRALKKAKSAPLRLTLVVGAPAPSTESRSQRARLTLRR
jgi:hypothetical protein